MSELSKAGKIRQAAAHLEKHGWKQGTFGGPEGSEPSPGDACCAHGALWVTTDYDQGNELATEFAKRLGLGASRLVLWEWNDADGRTKDEVVQALLDWADAVEESDAQPE